MTLWQRIEQLALGAAMIVLGILLIYFGARAYPLVIAILALYLEIQGLRQIWFYLRMARHMVGGRKILYRGLLAFDLGVFAGTLFRLPQIYVLLYIAGMLAFSGLVDILRAREAKGIGGYWKLKAFQGAVELVIALMCLVLMRSSDNVVYIVAAGFIFSAAMRIVNALRRSKVIIIN